MESTTKSIGKMIEVYIDGACSGNPGPGGWGVVLRYEDEDVTFSTFSGKEDKTTNNRMELTAAIKALEHLDEKDKVTLYTDSKYVKTGITEWIIKWKLNNWCGSNKKPVKNIDLWKELDTLNQKRQIDWIWVKGHSDNEGNILADKLARGI